MTALEDRIGLAPLDPSIDRAVRVVVLPAFVDGFAITVVGARADVRTVPPAPRPAYTRRGRLLVDGRFVPAERTVAAIDERPPRVATVELDGATRDELWHRIDAIGRDAPRSEQRVGLDGTTATITVVANGVAETLDRRPIWRATAAHALVSAVLVAVCPHLVDREISSTIGDAWRGAR